MIIYTKAVHDISSDQLEGFFANWPDPPSPTTHLRVLQNSAEVLLALDDETGRVVGFVNALSDGVLCAFVPLLEVLPAYQGQGIGRELMRGIVDQLGPLYAVDLMCDPDLQLYYQQLGMRPAVGMMFRDYDRQSGRLVGVSDD